MSVELFYVVVAVFLFGFVFFLLYLNLRKKLKQLAQANENLMLLFQNQQENESKQYALVSHIEKKLANISLESQQVTDQLALRTKNLLQQYSELKAELETLKHEQPEDKLYRRALKMVELGADIEEVMSECELPRAEAELLYSVHMQTNQNDNI